jgi:hypothetical protein
LFLQVSGKKKIKKAFLQNFNIKTNEQKLAGFYHVCICRTGFFVCVQSCGRPNYAAFQAITGNHHSKIPKICHQFVKALLFSVWFAVTSLI